MSQKLMKTSCVSVKAMWAAQDCSRLFYSHTLPCNNSHGTGLAALTDLTCCSQQDDGAGVVNSPAQL